MSAINTAIILAGGVGTRLRADIPKQFIEVGGRPIIAYCLDAYEHHEMIENIVIVADESWRDYLYDVINHDKITKFCSFADPGRTRQHSIFNGLTAAKNVCDDDDVVIIADAARPMTSEKIITDCLVGAAEMGGAMPVIPVKDTIYQSKDGGCISGLLRRSELFAGQAPEAFRFGEYLGIHLRVGDDEIAATAGSSEIGYRHDMKIKLVEGDERNFKITTPADLERFRTMIGEKEAK